LVLLKPNGHFGRWPHYSKCTVDSFCIITGLADLLGPLVVRHCHVILLWHEATARRQSRQERKGSRKLKRVFTTSMPQYAGRKHYLSWWRRPCYRNMSVFSLLSGSIIWLSSVNGARLKVFLRKYKPTDPDSPLEKIIKGLDTSMFLPSKNVLLQKLAWCN